METKYKEKKIDGNIFFKNLCVNLLMVSILGALMT